MKKKIKYNFDNQFGNGYYPGINYPRIGGLPEIVSYSDCNNNCLSSNFRHTLSVKPQFKNYQNGGNLYNYIVNPKTGNKVSIKGKTGKKIIKEYISKLYGGSEVTNNLAAEKTAFIGEHSNFNSNMKSRIFDCKQPNWLPNCI